jgi:hypothetical protein
MSPLGGLLGGRAELGLGVPRGSGGRGEEGRAGAWRSQGERRGRELGFWGGAGGIDALVEETFKLARG